MSSAPHRPSMLSDELLRRLMGAGQADIVIGIPTLNHADSVGPIVRTVNRLFSTVYVRERTVLFNPDGGSTDGTQEVIESQTAASPDVVMAPFALRTVHRISTAYHGVPGRGAALRLIFAAADLLRARVVAVIDPDARQLSVEHLHGFIRPIFERRADFVKPMVPRAATDGPLNSQLVRPLLRAMFGVRLAEPMDTLLACSGPFAAQALGADFWDNSYAQNAPEPWLLSLAARRQVRFSQVAMPAPGASRAYAEFGELFRQVVGSMFATLEATPATWGAIHDSIDVPCAGELVHTSEPQRSFDIDGFAAAFREAIDALSPLLERCVSPSTLAALVQAAAAPELRLDDGLWVRTVYDFVSTVGRHVMPLDQLVQLLQPIYLGRVSAWLGQAQRPASAGAGHEPLAQEFERQKTALIERWSDAGGER